MKVILLLSHFLLKEHHEKNKYDTKTAEAYQKLVDDINLILNLLERKF